MARMLDTWSQLAERYSRRLDEDDIIDIRTGQIVKDNGFWRATRRFNFGEALEDEDAEGPVGNESDDEGVDELDAFGEEHNSLDDVFGRGWQEKLLTHSSHDITSDLDEFLEAESRRKEEYGSDVEEGGLELSHAHRGGRTLSSSPPTDNDFDDNEESQNAIDDRPAASSPISESAPEEPTSDNDLDDELDNWEPTEASMVFVAKDDQDSSQGDESESDVEVIESPASVYKPVPPKQPTPAQLHTPPRSHSFADPPNLDPIPSPPRLPSPQPPFDPPPATRTREAPLSPLQPQIRASGTQSLRVRALTPEIIELTDDELAEAPSQPIYPPSPSPPSSPPPVRARSPVPSGVPEVVISTLPPRLAQTKQTIKPAALEPESTPLVKRTKKLVSPETPVGSSPSKKSTSKSKFSQLAKKVNDSTELKATRGRVTALVGEQETPKSVTCGASSREISPEIGEHPTSIPSVSSPSPPQLSKSPPKKRTSHKRKRSSSEHETITHEKVQKDLLPSKPRRTTKGEEALSNPVPPWLTRATQDGQVVLFHPAPRGALCQGPNTYLMIAPIQVLKKTRTTSTIRGVLPLSLLALMSNHRTCLMLRPITTLECIHLLVIPGRNRLSLKPCTNSPHCSGHQVIQVQLLLCIPTLPPTIDIRPSDRTSCTPPPTTPIRTLSASIRHCQKQLCLPAHPSHPLHPLNSENGESLLYRGVIQGEEGSPSMLTKKATDIQKTKHRKIHFQNLLNQPWAVNNCEKPNPAVPYNPRAGERGKGKGRKRL